MALNTSDSAVLVRPVNTVFQQTLLRNAKSRCVHFMGSVPGSVAHNMGSSTVTWRRIEIGSTTNARGALTELTAVTYGTAMGARSSSEFSITAPTATALKYGNFVVLTEEADLYNFNGQTDKLVEVLGIDAGDYLDYLQRVAMVTNLVAGSTIYAGGVASEGAVVSKITKAAIQSAVNALDKQKALTFTPMTTGSQNFGTSQLMPGFIAITHPDVAIDVTSLAGFKPAETYAGQTSLLMGEYGAMTVAGCTVRFVSGHNADVEADAGGLTSGTGLRSTTGTNIDTYTTFIYGREAIASLGYGATQPDGGFMAGDDVSSIQLINKPLGSGGTSDPYNEIGTIAYKFWHAGEILNDNWVRGIISGATSL